ncbi:MAG: FAD dependent oxidoreductase [Phormidium sp. OSCR]|nr:MAG: FAD dependent oxidoreductase [Phormidium sp. OSCR]
MLHRFSVVSLLLSPLFALTVSPLSYATPPREADVRQTCDLLVAGGGLSGAAAAYEALQLGKTVCLTEITDWVGGQISAQGTSALDERDTQRRLLFYPRGYLALRSAIEDHYGRLNPGACWVSESCFMPYDGHNLLFELLEDAAKQGRGTLHWFPNTVIKDLRYNPQGNKITSAIAIQHQPQSDAPPLNSLPLSATIEDAFSYEDSELFEKTIIEFRAQSPDATANSPDWYVIDATETGELIGLTDVPYRLGIDPRSFLEPTSSSETGDPYCTQGFTYTFAMEATEEPQEHQVPDFYQQYEPYYSYELERLANFTLVFTYRQIHSMKPEEPRPGNVREFPIYPGDISMQNWTWGNDYRPGTAEDNLIYSREQLRDGGQLEPGGWLGGLRTESLRRGEENAIGYFYWLVQGTTDSQLGEGVKEPHPNHRYLSGFDSPMGTAHGLSKYPYMREGRRIIGRPGFAHPDGFTVWEVDITMADFRDEFYENALTPAALRHLWAVLSGVDAAGVASRELSREEVTRRSRATLFPDTVGIGHYAIDFHPCMALSPPEAPGNYERPGERRGQGRAFPFQIPLRALIPQRLDNLLVAGKSIATSHIAAAAYRVHSFEWSAGAAAGTTAVFALEQDLAPYELVDNLPYPEPQLETLQRQLSSQGNPVMFPDTSIFNNTWDEWR